jgi:hypothetical protein
MYQKPQETEAQSNPTHAITCKQTLNKLVLVLLAAAVGHLQVCQVLVHHRSSILLPWSSQAAYHYSTDTSQNLICIGGLLRKTGLSRDGSRFRETRDSRRPSASTLPPLLPVLRPRRSIWRLTHLPVPHASSWENLTRAWCYPIRGCRVRSAAPAH